MKKYFYIDDSPIYKEKFLIRLEHENLKKFFPTGTNGSYNVFIARVAGLSYANFLRYCRDVLKGEIIGKNHKYPVVFFDRSNDLTQFVKMLNKNMEYLEYLYDHPYKIIEDEDGTLKKIPIKFEEN